MKSLLPKQHEKAVSIISKSNRANCFVYDDLLIRGDAFKIVKAFVTSESEATFKQWIEGKGLVIMKGFNNKLKIRLK